jgi:hypothetical protein
VTLVDANVLLYAYHPHAVQHERCRAWVEAALSGGAAVRISRATVVAFQRIGTNWDILRDLRHRTQVTAALCTTERDFARVPGLRTLNPLDG